MGCLGVYFAMTGDLITAGYCTLTGIFLDFFDGLAARLLKVSSELGKQLDSLADLITSGLVPALIVFQLFSAELYDVNLFPHQPWYAFIAFIIVLGSAYRLAKFNIDDAQSDKFIGLPTPANTLLILSLAFILEYSSLDWIKPIILNHAFLLILSLVSVVLLNMNVELFSLKLKSFNFKENRLVYVFLMYAVGILVFLRFIGVPIIIVSYILVSIISKKKSAKQNV